MDTTDLAVIDTCVVGYQPEEMVIVGNKLYVANSGGYRVPNYDNTVSVIDLAHFKEIKKIEVGINLHRMELDRYGNIWVSSRGDYKKVGSKTYVIDSKTDRVTDVLDLLPNSNMTLCGDSLYVYSTEWSWITNKNTITYAIVDTKTKRVVSRNFIRDGTDKTIQIPLRRGRQSRHAGDIRNRCERLRDARHAVLFRSGRKKEMVRHDRRYPRAHRIHLPKITAARIIAQQLRPVKQSRTHPPDRKTRQRSNGWNRPQGGTGKKIFADRIVFFLFLTILVV